MSSRYRNLVKSTSLTFIYYLALLCLSLPVTAVEKLDSESTANKIETPANQSSDYTRIVSAGGSITELLNALGVGENIIAVDSSSMYPARMTELPQVGYFRALGAEGVLSLQPDLLITARGAGPQEVLDQIEAAGVPVIQFSQSTYSLQTWETLVSEIGAFFDREDNADTLIKRTQISINEISKRHTNRKHAPRILTLMNSGNRGFTAAGKNTMPDLLINLVGAENAAAAIDGYKPFSAESLALDQIDLILTPHHTIDAMGGSDGICQNQSIKLATSKGCQVHVMDALLLLGFGARVDQALEQVANRLEKLSD